MAHDRDQRVLLHKSNLENRIDARKNKVEPILKVGQISMTQHLKNCLVNVEAYVDNQIAEEKRQKAAELLRNK